MKKIPILFMGMISSFPTFSSSDDWIHTDPPETIKPIEALQCNNPDATWYEQAVCERLADHLEEKLNSANMSIDENGIGYSAHVSNNDIPTGHGCSHTLKATGGNITAYIESGFGIGFDFDKLDDWYAMFLEVPLRVDGNVQMRDSLGFQEVFGHGCKEYSVDHYEMDTDVIIKSVHGFSLEFNPTGELLPNGDYRVAISPKFMATGDIDNAELDWESHDENFLHSLFVKAVEFFAVINQVFQYLLASSGDPEASWVDYRDEAIVHLGYGVLQPAHSIISNTDWVHDKVDDWAEEEGNKKLDEFYFGLEQNINNKMSKALGLNKSGQLSWTIDLKQMEHDLYIKKFRKIQPSLLIIEE